MSTARAVSIEQERCDGCWACVRSCPTSALEPRSDERGAEIAWSVGRCIYCGRCEMVCPRHAVRRTTALEDATRVTVARVLVTLPVWRCLRCGAAYGAGARREPPEAPVKAIAHGRGLLCPRCRQREAFRTELAGRGEGERC